MPQKLTQEIVESAIQQGHFVLKEGRVKFAKTAPEGLVDLVVDELDLSDFGDIRGTKDRTPLKDLEIPPLLGGIYVDIAKSILERKAKEAISAAWHRAGGDRSRVGVPLGGAISARMSSRNVWRAQFRSGEIETRFLNNNGQQVLQIVTSEMRIRLVGIECQMRQEGEDEIYATIGALRVADGETSTVKVPDWPMPGGVPYFIFKEGKAQGRMVSLDVPIVWGRPIQDVRLTVGLVETDKDDTVNAMKDKVAAVIVEKGREAVKDKTGLDAEALVSKEDMQNSIKDLMNKGLEKLLGMGPDVYEAGHLAISAREIEAGPARKPPFKRGDDSDVIREWTHEIVVRGRDDGGDRGQYRLFFDVTRVDIYEENPV